MNDIIRKQMKDVIVPQNDIVRRSAPLPEHSIVDVPLPGDSSRIEKNPFFTKDQRKNDKEFKNNAPRSTAFLWVLLIIALLGAGFVVANYFASASIEVTPVSRKVNLDNDFTVMKEGAAGELTFKFVSLTEEESKDVSATIEKKIQRKSSGKIFIYNTYSTEKQRLIKNTRLESSDHKIFRIDESVVVPGATIVAGKVTVPGSVEALVYADVAGKEYDINLLSGDFTIPGFKGDPRFAKFYGRMSEKSPIRGGFSGTVKVPSDEAVLAAREEIKQGLKKTAVEKARAQIPADVSFFPESMIVKFEDVPEEFTANAVSKVSERATISLFFFDTAVLTKKLAEIAVPADKEKIFSVPNISAITFSFIEPVDNVVLADISQIQFHLTGAVSFIGKVDSVKISGDLAGKDKIDFGKIIGSQNNIDRAGYTIHPMWKTAFPENPTEITVKIMTP